MIPKVCVVVAAYNPRGLLARTIDSVRAQTEPAWHCVVVDDGSPEDVTWVRDLDPRVRLVRQANQGVSAARNAGAARAEAPLLCFLDQDDLWQPTYLQRQLEQFGDSAVVLASTDFDIIGADGSWVGPGFVGHNRSYEDLLTGCGIQCSTVMIRRSAFDEAGGFRPFAVSQDWDLWLRVLRRGGRAARTDDVLGSWRRHAHNASDDYRALWLDGRRILAEHDHPAAAAGRRRVRELSGVQAFDAARAARGRPREIVHHLAWAATHAPGYTARSLLPRRRS